ncbi:MAG TPA: hypothetical protein VJP87_11290 [Candidatus Acidoferrales bacterium]|nr:hypothetical protein [Candidatus Acidoferrales bacterium]
MLISGPTLGVALAGQVRSLDWRRFYLCSAGVSPPFRLAPAAVSAPELTEPRAKLRALIAG